MLRKILELVESRAVKVDESRARRRVVEETRQTCWMAGSEVAA